MFRNCFRKSGDNRLSSQGASDSSSVEEHRRRDQRMIDALQYAREHAEPQAFHSEAYANIHHRQDSSDYTRQQEVAAWNKWLVDPRAQGPQVLGLRQRGFQRGQDAYNFAFKYPDYFTACNQERHQHQEQPRQLHYRPTSAKASIPPQQQAHQKQLGQQQGDYRHPQRTYVPSSSSRGQFQSNAEFKAGLRAAQKESEKRAEKFIEEEEARMYRAQAEWREILRRAKEPDEIRPRPDIWINSNEGDLVTFEDLQRAKKGFKLFRKMHGVGGDGWKRFLIQTEDGGLQAMVLGLKPCMLTEKFSDEYIEMLKKTF